MAETSNNIPNWQWEQAKQIQINLLPKNIPDWNGLSFDYQYQSLDVIGGDYLDFFNIKGHKKGILIADVCGHGIGPAIVTAMAKVSFSNHSMEHDSPKEIFQKVNKDLCKFLGDSNIYMTAFLIVIDQDLKITYSSAGHTPVIYYNNKEDSFRSLKVKGLFLGLFDDAWESYEEEELQLNPGDKIVMYTDGIIESRNIKGELYGNNRLEKTIKFSTALPQKKFTELLIKDIMKFCKHRPLQDDMSVLALQVSLDRSNFLTHFNKGKQLLEQKDDNWVYEFEKASAFNKENFIVNYSLGKYYFENGEYKKSSVFFTNLINSQTINSNIKFYMGNIYIFEKKYLKAISYFKEIINDDINFYKAWVNLIDCYLKIGKKTDALSVYDKMKVNFSDTIFEENIHDFIKNKKK